jgi:hypothetical protein
MFKYFLALIFLTLTLQGVESYGPNQLGNMPVVIHEGGGERNIQLLGYVSEGWCQEIYSSETYVYRNHYLQLSDAWQILPWNSFVRQYGSGSWVDAAYFVNPDSGQLEIFSGRKRVFREYPDLYGEVTEGPIIRLFEGTLTRDPMADGVNFDLLTTEDLGAYKLDGVAANLELFEASTSNEHVTELVGDSFDITADDLQYNRESAGLVLGAVSSYNTLENWASWCPLSTLTLEGGTSYNGQYTTKIITKEVSSFRRYIPIWRWIYPTTYDPLPVPPEPSVTNPAAGASADSSLSCSTDADGVLNLQVPFSDLNPLVEHLLQATFIIIYTDGTQYELDYEVSIPLGQTSYLMTILKDYSDDDLAQMYLKSAMLVNASDPSIIQQIVHVECGGTLTCPLGLDDQGTRCILVDPICVANGGWTLSGTRTFCCYSDGHPLRTAEVASACETCPPFQEYSTATASCVCPTGYTSSLVGGILSCNPPCPVGYSYNALTSTCEPRCGGGFTWVVDSSYPAGGLCVRDCPPGYGWDNQRNCCPLDSITVDGDCGCPLGTVRIGTVCVPECDDPFIYSYDGTCILPIVSTITYEDHSVVITLP